MNKKILLNIALFFTAIFLTARLSWAVDPLEAAPDMYKLIFENDRVRVMQVSFEVGQSIPEHSHPDHFVYVLEGEKLQITKNDGTVADADLKAGDVVWIDAETHSAVNTGTTPVKLLVTEMKNSIALEAPAVPAAPAEAAK